jgi:hypothetical protein
MHNNNKLPNKFVVEFDTFHELTFKERLKILFGYNLKSVSKVIMNRRERKTWAHTKLQLTKQLDPDGELREEFDDQAEYGNYEK